ncbi:MAG: ATP synthase F1 subunit epsilon [Candidatus Symbiothrix sp.]|jgi:F-type H+-transporting ATPase subunit epsilon|nr:ATP synthase F1 subunit epsilon [Candidatus Symbiothrix sp.]
MKLDIISPEKKLYQGDAELVTLPGMQGLFTVLENHAPIISGLNKGQVVYRTGGQDTVLPVNGGFVEVKNNEITVCVE